MERTLLTEAPKRMPAFSTKMLLSTPCTSQKHTIPTVALKTRHLLKLKQIHTLLSIQANKINLYSWGGRFSFNAQSLEPSGI
jgi:hypothetical protein